MEYGTLTNFIMKDIGEGKVFWVSGYANPNLRNSPKTNIKPTKVTMYKNDPDKPHRTGLYQYDKKFEYFVAKSDKGKIMPVSAGVNVYDTEEEAIEGYNESVEFVASLYQMRITKVLGNKIGN